MNKNHYRVIFNKVRGLMMVVAECVPSRCGASKGESESANMDQPVYPMIVTMPLLRLAVLLVTGSAVLMPLSATAAAAGIVADRSAPILQQPDVTQAANGVPLVNIQTPSAAGVSRNTYSQFDVNQQGAILNNSRVNAQTQLGGWVQGNPNLTGGTARVILNEVNSSNPSLLNGYVEIAGSRAQLVIANPAGISCDGCGFINANRATLTTGTPIMNNGSLLGYRVGGGSINFLGSGLDASQVNYTDVIARAVNVNAGIFANELNVITGSNQVNIDANGSHTSITGIAPNAGSNTPAFAIDVAALGGMYAGKIHMIGTEAGLGVRNANTIGASVGEVSITVDGLLQNAGIINAKTNIQLDAVALENNESIVADGSIDISLASDYIHTSELQAGGNLGLQTTGDIINQSALLASQSLTVSANNINNTATGEMVALTTRVSATDTFTNLGLVDGIDIIINAATLTNTQTGSVFGDHLAIQAAHMGNDAGAVIAARNRLDIGANSIENGSEGLIFSVGDLAIGGSLGSNNEATGSAGTLINDGSTIEALGNVGFAVTDLKNLNSNLATNVVMTWVGGFDRFTPRSTSVIWDSADYPGAYIGNVNVEWRNAGPYSFREYTRYLGTKRLYETQVVSSTPGQILSGGDMFITGSVTNKDSQIIAGGNLDVSGATVQNLNSKGQTITSYSGTSYYYDWDGNDNDYDVDVIGAYNPANTVQTYNLSTTRLVGNTAPVGSGVSVTSAAVPLVTNSLFQANPNVSSGYLIETNPRFANYRTWLSSDYMMQQLSFDPAITQKRLGDGFYEQRLVREQVAQLTGRRFLPGYASDEAQFQALMMSAVTQADSLQLIPGVALTSAQIAQLTSDIVWLIEQAVTLPDGTITKALVPQVYVRLQVEDLHPTTGIMSGNSVSIALSGDMSNQGTIAGREFVALTADNIHNLDGQIVGEITQLTAINDINNIGGQIIAEDAMLLNAGNDINLRSTTQSSQNTEGASSFSRTNIDRVAGLYLSNPNAILVASAGNDVNLMAASIVNQGENGVTQINAVRNINLGTVTIAEQNSSIRNAKNYVKHGGTQEIGSVIETTGNIAFNAGNDFNAKAASVTSEAGAINVSATRDINITDGRETSNFDTARKVKKSGTFSSTTKMQHDVFKSDNSVSSSFSGDTVALQAGDNINITGSNVVSDNGTSLIAGDNIRIAAAKNTAYEFHERKTKKSGLSTSGASVSLGTQKLNTKQTSNSTSHAASTVGSVEGDVNITAGENYKQIASDVIVPQGDVNIAAQRVDITAAQNTNVSIQETKFKQSGITLSISNPIVSAIQTVDQMRQSASETSDPRMKSLAAATAALSVKNAYDMVNLPDQYGNVPTAGNTGSDDLANVRTANLADQVGGINVSVSVGSSKSSSKSTQTTTSAQGSQVMAGGDINITAQGASQDSDINIIGSQIQAGENISITAADQVNLIAAKNIETLNSKNKGSSASLGASFGTNGLVVSASASKGKGKANGNDITWTETIVEAGNKISMESGTDTSLIGAQVKGRQVVADVGTSGIGNLNVQSLQDISAYNSKQKSSGFSVSVPIGAGSYGGSISSSNTKIESDYTSVNEQAGIFAGDEGFQVSVASNTNLTGAVIASSKQAIQDGKNSLASETLTASDIQNKAEYEADSSSSNLSLSYDSTKTMVKNLGNNLVNLPSSLVPELKQNGSDSSLTRSAISASQITITDDEKQRKLTGKDAATTIATLNRDADHANPTTLARPQIESIEQEQAANSAITSAAVVQVTQAVNTYYTKRIAEYDRQYNETINQAREKEAQASILEAVGDGESAATLKQEAQLLRSQAIDLRNERDNPALSQGLAQALGTALIGGLAGQVDAGQIATSYSLGTLGNTFLLTAQKRDSDITQGLVVTCNSTLATCSEAAAGLGDQINNAETPLEERIRLLQNLQVKKDKNSNEMLQAFTIILVDKNSGANPNIAINGILNEPDRAGVLAIGHLRDGEATGQSIYLSYNDTQGGLADLLNAFIDKNFAVASNPSIAAAQAIIDAGEQAHTYAYAHSGGTLISNIALNSLSSLGYANQNLHVDYFGPASTMSKAAAVALNAAGLSNASVEQKQNWLLYGNVDGLPAEITKPEDIQNYIKSHSGLNYLNNPNDPVATFIGFNFGQTNQYNDSQSASYLQGATEGNVMQSMLETYSLLTTSNSAHSRYRWNDPSTWPTQPLQ